MVNRVYKMNNTLHLPYPTNSLVKGTLVQVLECIEGINGHSLYLTLKDIKTTEQIKVRIKYSQKAYFTETKASKVLYGKSL